MGRANVLFVGVRYANPQNILCCFCSFPLGFISWLRLRILSLEDGSLRFVWETREGLRMYIVTNAQVCKPTPIKNVLSLFDGISCGQLALRMAGIDYEKYYASEIEDFSIRVTQNRFPDTVQLGDVQKVRGSDLPSIDLLFAGSPCQGLSRCGYQKNFDDERSKLYYEFLRLLKETNPKYFLLENVCMDAESENIITEDLGVKPYYINSAVFCAQQRPRLYWTNLPIKNLPLVASREVVQDILETTTTEIEYSPPYLKISDWEYELSHVSSFPYGKFSRKVGHVGNKEAQATKVYSTYSKSVCLLANGGGQGGKTGLYAIGKNKARKLTPLECERLQMLPDGYTDCVKGSSENRYKAIGNGWTVGVISHLLQGIK